MGEKRAHSRQAEQFGRRAGVKAKPARRDRPSKGRRPIISVFGFSVGLVAGAGFAALIGLGFAAPVSEGGARPGVVQAGKRALMDAPPRVLEARGWVVSPQNTVAQAPGSKGAVSAVLELDLSAEPT